MLYLDLPTPGEIGELNRVRADACVSIYLATTPITQQVGESRVRLRNLVKTAVAQLEAAGLDKRRLWPVEAHFESILEDDGFWEYQARSLAILATPDRVRTWRLANELQDIVAVSDRFHLKPLLRAVTFPHAARVLAVSENAVRLVQVSPDLPAAEVRVPGLPASAASAVGKASINDSGPGRRIQGLEGQKVRLAQYVRKIDAALRPILRDSGVPLILAATEPLASLFRATSALPLLRDTIATSPDRMTDAELAGAARPVLDAHYENLIAAFRERFDRRAGDNRATTDIADAARAATFGAIDALLIDIDSVIDGTLDEETGAVTFADAPGASSYGVADEIAGRALDTGAHVLAVRKADIPGGKDLAAILRRPL